jgi:hypothetical protein
MYGEELDMYNEELDMYDEEDKWCSLNRLLVEQLFCFGFFFNLNSYFFIFSYLLCL